MICSITLHAMHVRETGLLIGDDRQPFTFFKDRTTRQPSRWQEQNHYAKNHQNGKVITVAIDFRNSAGNSNMYSWMVAGLNS